MQRTGKFPIRKKWKPNWDLDKLRGRRTKEINIPPGSSLGYERRQVPNHKRDPKSLPPPAWFSSTTPLPFGRPLVAVLLHILYRLGYSSVRIFAAATSPCNRSQDAVTRHRISDLCWTAPSGMYVCWLVGRSCSWLISWYSVHRVESRTNQFGSH
jgi:hypothetical protein